MNKSVVIWLLPLSLLSCDRSFETVTITRELPAFDQIMLNSSFLVYISEEPLHRITIEAAEDIAQKTTVGVNNRILAVQSKFKSQWLRPDDNKIILRISLPSLKLISVNESCLVVTITPITSDSLTMFFKTKLNEARIDLDGSIFESYNEFPCGGLLTLTGNSPRITIWNDALMTVDAQDLVAVDALVQNGSKGSCKVRVTNRLDYSIRGEGNIYSYGIPARVVEGEVSSTGRLIFRY